MGNESRARAEVYRKIANQAIDMAQTSLMMARKTMDTLEAFAADVARGDLSQVDQVPEAVAAIRTQFATAHDALEQLKQAVRPTES